MQDASNLAFRHLVESLHNPQLSESNQEAFNEQNRMSIVLDAMKTRPAFLPVQLTLPAAVQQLPKSESTNDLQYNVIIHGAITDGEEKKINFRRNSDDSIPFVSVGREVGSQISLDAIAGKSLESGGKSGIQELMPFLLRSGESLAVDIYKPVATLGIDVVSVCFTGSRVFTKTISEEFLTSELRDVIAREIIRRVTSEPRFAVCDVKFSDHSAQAETPKVSEPRLVHGFRTTVKNALVNLGFDADAKFARDFFPVWALAAEAGNGSENYRYLKTPIFLAPNQQLYFSLKDTINGINYADDGQIEILESTL
jgi:hypothetical protein